MNRAIDSCDIVAFENAAGAAGNLQELHGTVAHGERMLRYLSAKPCRVHIGAPETLGQFRTQRLVKRTYQQYIHIYDYILYIIYYILYKIIYIYSLFMSV